MLIPPHNYTVREQTVCDILRPLEGCRTMLNVGMRDPEDERHRWWLKICEANEIEPAVIEACLVNAKACRKFVDRVYVADICDWRFAGGEYDIVLWWHGPEHVEKFRALSAIAQLWRGVSKALILGCPQGYSPQGVVNGNPYERHRSEWQPEEFEQNFDMHTTVVDDGQLAPHITAWKIFDEI